MGSGRGVSSAVLEPITVDQRVVQPPCSKVLRVAERESLTKVNLARRATEEGNR